MVSAAAPTVASRNLRREVVTESLSQVLNLDIVCRADRLPLLFSHANSTMDERHGFSRAFGKRQVPGLRVVATTKEISG